LDCRLLFQCGDFRSLLFERLDSCCLHRAIALQRGDARRLHLDSALLLLELVEQHRRQVLIQHHFDLTVSIPCYQTGIVRSDFLGDQTVLQRGGAFTIVEVDENVALRKLNDLRRSK
jgi:hypothetical protein